MRKQEQIGLRIDTEKKKILQEIAKQDGRTLTNLILWWIDQKILEEHQRFAA